MTCRLFRRILKSFRSVSDNVNMVRVRSWQFLSAALVGTIVYALLSMTVGSDGMWCYKQLEAQRRTISSRVASIQKINDELTKERMALERDRNVIAAYAHRLEYVKDNEKLIKMTGLKPYESTLYDTGTPLCRREIKCMSEAACKAAGLAFFVLVSLIMLLFDIAREADASPLALYSDNDDSHLASILKEKKVGGDTRQSAQYYSQGENNAYVAQG